MLFFNRLQSLSKTSALLRLHKYGFVIYFLNKLSLHEMDNIKAVVQLLEGNVFFFNSKKILTGLYYNCLVITFSNFFSVFNFPYYLDTIFMNFNYFPVYFKFYANLIPINNNFLFKHIYSLSNVYEDNNIVNLTPLLNIQRRRIFILFKFFFNSFFILNYKKQCQH